MTLEEELHKILIEGASEEELAKCKLAELKPVNPDSRYNQRQLEMGIEVEKEHTHNPNLAKMITKHHLDENDPEKSTYYDRLEDLEAAEKADQEKRDKATTESHHHERITYSCGCVHTCRCSAPKINIIKDEICPECREQL